MLCRAGKRVLIKASFAKIDAKPECFTVNRVTKLSHGDGGREKQPRSSTQIWEGSVGQF